MQIQKKSFPFFIGLFLFLLNGTIISHAQVRDRPNILLILVDDLRYDCFSNTGNTFSQSPAIESIAKEGVSFDQTFVITSICRPSRTTILTGRYPSFHGVYHNRQYLDTTSQTIATILHDNGYNTGFIGKFHSNGQPYPGWDRWVSFSNQGTYENPLLNVDGSDSLFSGHMNEILTDLMIEFIRQPRTKPFFGILSHKAVHYPFVTEPQFIGSLDHVNFAMPPTYNEDPLAKPKIFYQFIMPFGEDTIKMLGQMYYEQLASVDLSVSRVLNELEAQGILDNTLVVITSDNGFFWGEHHYYGKRLPHEESIRIPLFIRYPAWFQENTVIDDQIALNVDVAQTFLDAAGLSDTFNMEGISLRKLADGSENRKSFLYTYNWDATNYTLLPSFRTVRSLRYKYTSYNCIFPYEEFYDLVDDPKETINSYFHQNQLTFLKSEMLRLIEKHNENPVGFLNCGNNLQTQTNTTIYSSFPNPTHNITHIVYELQNDSHVRVDLYNLIGEHIKILLETDVKRGPHTFDLDVSDIPHGLYFYEINTGSKTKLAKLVVQ